jgi:hypothetical protein
MVMTFGVAPIVALIAGILILLIPRLLNYIIAFYLIIVGLLGLLGGPRGTVAAGPVEAPPAAVQHVTPAPQPPGVAI